MPLTLDYKILEKLSCIICTDFLEFVATKFNLNLACLTFISLY